MKVINLFAGPGTGKSTTAAGLFSLMKDAGFRIELVTEFAKDCVWDGVMPNQLLIAGQQLHRLQRLIGKVDYVVTDSPLLLSAVYAERKGYPVGLVNTIVTIFKTFVNVNFLLRRDPNRGYDPVGRQQTADEARRIDAEVEDLLVRFRVPYLTASKSSATPHAILEAIP